MRPMMGLCLNRITQLLTTNEPNLVIKLVKISDSLGKLDWTLIQDRFFFKFNCNFCRQNLSLSLLQLSDLVLRTKNKSMDSYTEIILTLVFEMAAMPFLCKGILLFQCNLPRVLSVSFENCSLSHPLNWFVLFLLLLVSYMKMPLQRNLTILLS